MNGSVKASRGTLAVLTFIAVIAAMRLAQEVLVPVALALLLTFLLVPIVDRLQRWGVNRAIAVAVAVTIAMSVLGGVAYVVLDQFTDLAEDLPQYRRQLRENVRELTGALRGGVSGTAGAVETFTREIERAAPPRPTATPVPKVQVVEPPPSAMEAVKSFVGPLLKPLGIAALVIVFVIFMLLRFADLRDRIIRLLGPRNLHSATEALTDASHRVSRYLIAQTLINGGQGIAVAVGLSLIGVPNAILWGSLTLVLRFIPYVGPWAAAAFPIALSFAVFDNWVQPILTIVLFIVLESISNMIVEPWLYGSHTGVSPVALLVAAAFWAWLWGPVGLFLAIPLTVCLVVIGKYVPQLEFLYVLLGDEPVLAPHERLYQRLLAGNHDEADNFMNEELCRASPREVRRVVVIPAMRFARYEQRRGRLVLEQYERMVQELERWDGKLQQKASPSPPAAA